MTYTPFGVFLSGRHLLQNGEGIDISFIIQLIQERKTQCLLDIGCGDGRLIHMVKRQVQSATGVDLSDRAIAFARAFNPDIGFFCGDIENLYDQYDTVTLIETLEHIPDIDLPNFVKNTRRLVTNDGILIISVPTVNLPLHCKHYRHYTLPLLKEQLAPHFQVTQTWWLYRRGFVSTNLRRLLINRFFVLNHSALRKLIWRFHRQVAYFADEQSGAHLICTATPV